MSIEQELCDDMRELMQELGVADDAYLARLKAALITKARLRNQVEVAKRIVLAGVGLMTNGQLARWGGVRTFLEQDTDAYEPFDAPVAAPDHHCEITLTVGEIKDLVECAGLALHPGTMPDEDDLNTEFTIRACPKDGVLDDDGVARHYGFIAFCTDYPEEGCMPLGPELEETAK